MPRPGGDPTRREPNELRALYVAYPEERDVYVEGRRDVPIISRFLRESGAERVKVYSIDDRVAVEPQIVTALGLDVGARGRLQALAHLTSEWTIMNENLTCLADLDWDGAPGRSRFDADALLYTDGCSLEVLFLKPQPVTRLLDEIGRGRPPAEVDALIERIIGAANQVFAVRLALHESALATVINFSKDVKVGRDGAVQVATDAILRRSLQGMRDRSTIEQVHARFDEIRRVAPSLGVQAVRGHDIAPLIIAILGLRNDLAKVETIEREMRLCLTVNDLSASIQFASLRTRLGI